jgi:sporulation protein YlmC with PRC-barrel domain
MAMQSFRLTTSTSAGRIAVFATLVAAALAGAYLFGEQSRGLSVTLAPSQPSSSAPRFKAHQTAAQWRAPLLVGVEVHDSDGNRVGAVEDLLMTHDGMVQTVVIGVGGVLGFGTKQVAVPFAEMQWRMDAHASLVVDARAAEAPADPKGLGCAATVEAVQGRPDRAGVTATLAELQAAPSFAYASRGVRVGDIRNAWDDNASPYR